MKRLTPKEFQKNLRALAKLGPRDKSYQAQMIRAQSMYHKDWLHLNEDRHHMRLAWADFFNKYDLLLCPVAATTAFPHNQKGERWERMITVNGRPQPSTTQMFWAGYSCNFCTNVGAAEKAAIQLVRLRLSSAEVKSSRISCSC